MCDLDEIECDYDLFRDLTEMMPQNEHPLDRALRTNDVALRTYYWEHGNASDWDTLPSSVKDSYKRPPAMPEPRLPKGTYYIYGKGTSLIPITAEQASENWVHAFCVA